MNDRHTNDVDVLVDEARRRGWKADPDERGNDHFARLALVGAGGSIKVERDDVGRRGGARRGR